MGFWVATDLMESKGADDANSVVAKEAWGQASKIQAGGPKPFQSQVRQDWFRETGETIAGKSGDESCGGRRTQRPGGV